MFVVEEEVIDRLTRIIEKLKADAIEALAFAELRFSAMAESTMQNGAPSPKELICICTESALKLDIAIEKIKGVKPSDDT